jgi:hypothetical protein
MHCQKSSKGTDSTMTTLEYCNRSDQSVATIRRLELTVMWLWSSEPNAGPDERARLLTRLSAASIDVERLVYRHEFHPDAPVDVDALEACRSEIQDLARWWVTLGPHPPITAGTGQNAADHAPRAPV